MNANELRRVYGESRNGANYLERHGLMRKLVYSDGVKEVADCGCWWLLDIIGTEVVRAMRSAHGAMGIVTVRVSDGAAVIELSVQDGAPPAWSRDVDFTDMPEGTWTFYITADMDGECTLILPSEY